MSKRVNNRKGRAWPSGKFNKQWARQRIEERANGTPPQRGFINWNRGRA